MAAIMKIERFINQMWERQFTLIEPVSFARSAGFLACRIAGL
jgi:hypothetical protein